MNRRNERGSVFVVTLGILAVLVSVLASIAASQQLAQRAQIHRMEARRARMAAESALQRAIAVLNPATATTASTTPAASTTSTAATTLQDDWATLGNNGDERFTLGSTSFRIQIVDAAAFLNLNTIDQATLQRLPLTQEQIDSLLDWRDTSGATAQPDGGKDEYYNSLPNAYNAKLRRLDTIDELLLVRGFTARDIYDLPANQPIGTALPNLADGREATLADLITVDSFTGQNNPNGQAKVNVNARTPNLAQAITNPLDRVNISQGAPYATLGAVLQRVTNPTTRQEVLDNLTVSPQPRIEGKINLNTATEAVLEALPNMTPDIAQAIVQRQSQGFTKLSDLLTIPGLNTGNTLQSVADAFTVQSNTFIVRVIGEAGSTKISLQAVIDLQSGTPKVLRMEDPPFDDMVTRWGWTADPNTTTEIKAAP